MVSLRGPHAVCCLVVAQLCCHCCSAVFADAWNLLMKPVDILVEANQDCGWVKPVDLRKKAHTSSEFEENIEIREDGCGNEVLLMGGFIQCHSVDEHIYHEMMVHPALVSFAATNGRPPSSVFLGGSGDGAGPREVLRWKSVKSVTMVDIDYEVTRFAQEYIPTMANGSFQDPRLKLITGDAVSYLQNLPEFVTFDVLILDFPDAFDSPILEKLYEEEFYTLCRSRMHSGSLIVTQSDSCAQVTMLGIQAECFVLERIIVENMAAVFDHVDVIMHPMATWKKDAQSSSEWAAFTIGRIGGGSQKPGAPLEEAADEHDFEGAWDGDLRYYNAAVHRAAFQIPRPLSDRLQKLKTAGQSESEL